MESPSTIMPFPRMNPPKLSLAESVLASGLRGRGGGWFPAGRKWQSVLAEGGDPFVVGNGAEGEPGSHKDRFAMLDRPEKVVQGLVLAAQAVGAREAVIYLKGSFAGPEAALRTALSSSGGDIQIRIVRGEEGYVAGEETAVLETLEGHRPWPRPKPPLPSAVGFQGRPTLVQNVETLSWVGAAVADPAAFRREERTLVSLWGHVRRPGVYEVRLGTALATIIEECGGGAPNGIGMIFPGGPSAPPLLPRELGLGLDPDVLRSAGSGLGSASLLVLGADVCPVAAAVSLANFFERESCLQCPPCSVGTASMARLVKGIEEGAGKREDLNTLGEMAGFISSHGYCAHGRTGARSVMGVLSRFANSVEEHLRGGRCQVAASDPFGEASPERRAIEATVPDSAHTRP